MTVPRSPEEPDQSVQASGVTSAQTLAGGTDGGPQPAIGAEPQPYPGPGPYAQPAPGPYAQPASGGYAQPASGAYPQPAPAGSAPDGPSAYAHPGPAATTGPTVGPAGPAAPTGPTVGRAASETVAALSTTTRTFLSGLDPTGWRPTLTVAGILIALVLGTQLINGVIPASARTRTGTPGVPGETRPGSPIQVTDGLTFLPYTGWQEARRYTDDLPGVVLQKGNVIFEVRATRDAFGGSLTDFLNRVANQVASQLSGFQYTEPRPIPLGNGLNGVRLTYQGTNNSNGRVQEGEMTVFLTPSGVGILAHAAGQQGSIDPLLNEVHAMLGTLELR